MLFAAFRRFHLLDSVHRFPLISASLCSFSTVNARFLLVFSADYLGFRTFSTPDIGRKVRTLQPIVGTCSNAIAVLLPISLWITLTAPYVRWTFTWISMSKTMPLLVQLLVTWYVAFFSRLMAVLHWTFPSTLDVVASSFIRASSLEECRSFSPDTYNDSCCVHPFLRDFPTYSGTSLKVTYAKRCVRFR